MRLAPSWIIALGIGCSGGGGDGVPRCGPATEEVGGVCIATPPCGGDTVEIDGACVGVPPCAADLEDEDGICAPDPDVRCGPGTVERGGECVSTATVGPTYEVRVADHEIPADGMSRVPVLVLGREASGEPALGDVVLDTTRPGAGVFDPAGFALEAEGATAFFVPCRGDEQPGCLGPFQITVALASAPSAVVARSRGLELVEATGVGSADPCLVGGNVVVLEGDSGDFIHPGADTIVDATFSATEQPFGDPQTVTIQVTPVDERQGLWWHLTFSSAQLGEPLAPFIYEEAERAAFASEGHPGLDVGGDGRGCNRISGRFQIHEITADNDALATLTATFEQHCEGFEPMLRGCVHYESAR